MKTGTGVLSARVLSEPLPDSLIVPAGSAWPQSHAAIVTHPELELVGTRRGAHIERRLEKIVADARRRDVPEVTILLIAPNLNSAPFPDYLINRLRNLSDKLEIVFFARAQRAILPSYIAHRIQSWIAAPGIRPDIAGNLEHVHELFHYDEHMRRWSGEGHTVTVIPCLDDDRKTDGLITRFARITGIPVPPATGEVVPRAILGKEQLIRVAELKDRLSRYHAVPIVGQVVERMFESARHRILKESQGARWVLTAAERRGVTEHFRESNGQFKKLLGATARREDWKKWFAELETPRQR